jgi:hypothetical protein
MVKPKIQNWSNPKLIQDQNKRVSYLQEVSCEASTAKLALFKKIKN